MTEGQEGSAVGEGEGAEVVGGAGGGESGPEMVEGASAELGGYEGRRKRSGRKG